MGVESVVAVQGFESTTSDSKAPATPAQNFFFKPHFNFLVSRNFQHATDHTYFQITD